MWDKFVKQHENIVLVMSGHDPCENIVVSQRNGEKGNLVTEMLIDPQGIDNDVRPTGMVAMLYFSEDGRTVSYEWYSTIQEKYYKASNMDTITINVVGVPEPDPEETDPPVNTDPEETDPPVNTDPEETDPPVNTDPDETDPPVNTDPEETDHPVNTDPEETDPPVNTEPEETDPPVNTDEAENSTETGKESLKEPEDTKNTDKASETGTDAESEKETEKETAKVSDKETESDSEADDAETSEEEGCGSVISGAAIALTAIVALGAGIMIKKKEDNN